MRFDPVRRSVVIGALSSVAPWGTARAADLLTIGAARGTIDFAIGDSRLFRTTGTFRDWRGRVRVDEADVSKSSVEVVIRTASIEMLDRQQTSMMKEADFFDVTRFPEMLFRSVRIERTGADDLRVQGDITLRGITKPMTFSISVSGRRPEASPGERYAHFRGSGRLQRSQFGMTKYVDVVGDTVDISIRADAWR